MSDQLYSLFAGGIAGVIIGCLVMLCELRWHVIERFIDWWST